MNILNKQNHCVNDFWYIQKKIFFHCKTNGLGVFLDFFDKFECIKADTLRWYLAVQYYKTPKK